MWRHGTLYAYYQQQCRCPICVSGRRAALDRMTDKMRAKYPSRAWYRDAYLEQKRLAEAAVQRAAQYWTELQQLRRRA